MLKSFRPHLKKHVFRTSNAVFVAEEEEEEMMALGNAVSK